MADNQTRNMTMAEWVVYRTHRWHRAEGIFGGYEMPMTDQTSELDEDAIDKAARVVWDEYPEYLYHWDRVPETALSGPSKSAFRRIACAVARTYAEHRTYAKR